MANENDQHQNGQQNTKANEDTENIFDDNFKINKNEACDNFDGSKNTQDEDQVEPAMGCKGKLNDLVADLCLNGHRNGGQNSQTLPNLTAYGDYTNIRATSGPVALGESNLSTQSSFDGCTTTAPTHNVHQQPPTQNSSFSFKHFLSSNSVPTAPSTTVTSLDPPANSTSTTSSTNATTSSRSLQTSTGARPKVPQSNSVSSTSISSLTVGGLNETAATKMKRSPRFSSFDSQASLAEYAGSTNTADLPTTDASAGCSTEANDFCLYSDEKERDRFQEWNLPSNANTMTTNSTDYDRGTSYVPRSHSNYDMPRPQTSPRRRVGIGASIKDTRPTRLSLITGQNPTTAAKLKLDLPLTSNSTGCGGNNASGATGSSRKTGHCSRPTDFPISNSIPGAAAAAAALPDFVQDHWMDSWYANDMHVNSPPSSPLMEDINGAGASGASGVLGQAGLHHNLGNRAIHLDNAPLPGPTDRGDFNIGLPESTSSVGSKMLPDFLSDGPIIHSSQRLADVAAGLPSNSIGSPEESSINNQLSRLRSENERLQRDLNETRIALNDQTLRANNLERQLIEQQRLHKTESEESQDKNKKNTTAVQAHVTKLKQKVQQLSAEVEILRRERDLMREEGAVGGCSVQSCDRSYAAGDVSSTMRSTSVTAAVTGKAIDESSGTNSCVAGSTKERGAGGGNCCGNALGIRPSNQQQLSRDLRRAASNAEQNLKQLLAGVENLRQMAAKIEKSETRVDYDASPDLFSDFLDECDDYDKYTGGGPAL